MKFFWKRKKKEVAPKPTANIGLTGHEVYVVEGKPQTMDKERRYQRDYKRMKLAAEKLAEMEKLGVKPEDPLYEEWSIEYQKRSLGVRQYHFNKRRAK